MFIAFDTDGNGKISTSEFIEGMGRHGIIYSTFEV
jgi:Ca2+-binding EF-hand superfamily protein